MVLDAMIVILPIRTYRHRGMYAHILLVIGAV